MNRNSSNNNFQNNRKPSSSKNQYNSNLNNLNPNDKKYTRNYNRSNSGYRNNDYKGENIYSRNNSSERRKNNSNNSSNIVNINEHINERRNNSFKDEIIEEENYVPYSEKKRLVAARNARLLPMFVFLLITIYLGGHLIGMATTNSKIGLETVLLGTLDSLQEYEGIIVRSEYVATAPVDGQVEYAYAQGDRVSKNSVVAIVQDELKTTPIEQKILEIDQSILKTQKNRSDISIYSEDIARIDQDIQQIILQNASSFMDESMSSVYDVKSRVQTAMNQRNEIWFSENIAGISQLTSQKFEYENQLEDSITSVRASESGIITFTYDGLEEEFNFDSLDDITQAQIGKASVQEIDKDHNFDEGEAVFKIISNNQWYIVAFLPKTSVLDWKADDVREISLKSGSEKIAISCKIRSITSDENTSKVVFSTFERVDAFMNERNVILYPEINVTDGLKIPNSALVEKTLMPIPRNYITQVSKDICVRVVNKDGEEEKLVPVSIITSDSAYNYVDVSTALNVGDNIINNDGVIHEVSSLRAVPGVYAANTSLARFTYVEVLEQNLEYAIIKSGDAYSIKPYDLIVSDAKNIIEGQSLY